MAHTSSAISPASRAHTYRSATVTPPLPMPTVAPHTPCRSSVPAPPDRTPHSLPAPDPLPHAAPWQTSASPVPDAPPQSPSAPMTKHPASSSERPATTDYYAVIGRTSARDRRSAPPATPPPIA